MNLKAALGCFLIITMNTVVSDIFIFGLDMVFKLSFVRHCKITFFTVISCVIMPCSSMNLNAGLGCRLIITFWALELYIFVFCLWMNSKASLLGCCLVITMNTIVSNIFMFCLDMVFQLPFIRHCKITAVHDIFIFMFCLWVNSKASFCCCLVLTMNTAVYDIFWLEHAVSNIVWKTPQKHILQN